MNHTDVVARIKQDGLRLDLRRLELAKYIVIHAAWALRSEGAGLRRKPGGSGFDWNGTHYSGDLLSYLTPQGAVNVDILGSAGGPEAGDQQMVDDDNNPGHLVLEALGNVPQWSPFPPDPNVDEFHVPAIDPGDDKEPDVPDSNFDAIVADIKQTFVNQMEAQRGEMNARLDATDRKVDALAAAAGKVGPQAQALIPQLVAAIVTALTATGLLKAAHKKTKK